jgi:hypothetical protein
MLDNAGRCDTSYDMESGYLPVAKGEFLFYIHYGPKNPTAGEISCAPALARHLSQTRVRTMPVRQRNVVAHAASLLPALPASPATSTFPIERASFFCMWHCSHRHTTRSAR